MIMSKAPGDFIRPVNFLSDSIYIENRSLMYNMIFEKRFQWS